MLIQRGGSTQGCWGPECPGSAVTLLKPLALCGPQCPRVFMGLSRQCGVQESGDLGSRVSWAMPGSYMLFWASVSPSGK